MNYADIKWYDVANGPGVRISLFVSGCSHKCPGCFNEEAWDYEYGQEYNEDITKKIIDTFKENPDKYDGISILGGEPLDLRNIPVVFNIIRDLNRGIKKNPHIWLYSGYTFEELVKRMISKNIISNATYAILSNIDVLVDGRFVEEKKDLSLNFRGSSNQRLIDMQKTMFEYSRSGEFKTILLDLDKYVQYSCK